MHSRFLWTGYYWKQKKKKWKYVALSLLLKVLLPIIFRGVCLKFNSKSISGNFLLFASCRQKCLQLLMTTCRKWASLHFISCRCSKITIVSVACRVCWLIAIISQFIRFYFPKSYSRGRGLSIIKFDLQERSGG